MTSTPLASQDVLAARDLLCSAGSPIDEAEIVESLHHLELLKSAACAAQASLAVALDHAVRAREAAAGVIAAHRGRGVASQVALARQESPFRGRVLLGLAKDLHTDLDCTLEALRAGRLNEERAMVVARETGCLGREDRAEIDEQVCGDAETLAGLGTQQLAARLRRLAAVADPASVTRRARKAAADRRVSIRPAPDTMTYVSGLLPVAQGVACFASLTREADRLRAAGDERTKGQLMADLFVERLTGQATADAVPITIDLVISDETLLGQDHAPAVIPGHGPVPAQIAREIVARALDGAIPPWLRRLYADPTRQLVALTSRQRFAPAGLADFIGLRDAGLCRTPWCDAPIRHIDHVEPAAAGGETSALNAQGLCEQCNHAKQAPGWTQTVLSDEQHTVETVTPTGHRHRSRAPTLPSPARGRPAGYLLDIAWVGAAA